MSNLTVVNGFELALIQGDLSKLTSEQKLSYYKNLCESVGLNPLTKPFEYMRLNGKEVLYANKGCAEQLRNIHKISIKVTAIQKIDDLYVVTTEGTDKSGRTDSATGAVSISGLKGEALANAMMKAETKSKRRLTLSICGLNMPDETEVDSIPGATVGVMREASKPSEPTQKPALKPIPNIGPSRISVSDEHYVIPIGKKHLGKKLSEMDPYELNNYLHWLKGQSESSGKPIEGKALEFVTIAERYLDSMDVEKMREKDFLSEEFPQ